MPSPVKFPPLSSATIIRACLVGLPLGILLLGVISVVLAGHGTAPKHGQTEAKMPTPPMRMDLDLVTTVRRHVETLATRIGPRSSKEFENLEAARFYLLSTLGPSNLGYTTREQSYAVRQQTFSNIEAELTGRRWPKEIIVVGAHYDSISTTPGADDNASGSLAMLALAELLSGHPQGRTIRFVAFTNEEPPWFQGTDMGSVHYASDLKTKGENVVAMLALESIGYFSDLPGSQKYPAPLDKLYPNVGNFVAVVGSPQSGKLVDFVHAAMHNGGPSRWKKAFCLRKPRASDGPITGPFGERLPRRHAHGHRAVPESELPSIDRCASNARLRTPGPNDRGDSPSLGSACEYPENFRGEARKNWLNPPHWPRRITVRSSWRPCLGY